MMGNRQGEVVTQQVQDEAMENQEGNFSLAQLQAQSLLFSK